MSVPVITLVNRPAVVTFGPTGDEPTITFEPAVGYVTVQKAGDVAVRVGQFAIKGDLGPLGPAGPAGVAQKYTHTQASASATWIVNHNLGSYPSVEIFTPGGVRIEASVIQTSINLTQISFNTPQSGFAICQ